MISGYVNTINYVPIIIVGDSLLTANARGLPVAYQWYTVSGYPPVYSPIAGATSSSYNYNNVSGNYVVVVTYINGKKDTSAPSKLLPLVLQSFKGIRKEQSNNLTWITEDVLNTTSFIIERSIDGINYKEIGLIQAFNNKNSDNLYHYSDNDISGSIKYYYRLKIIDANAVFTYSPVVILNKEIKSIFQIQPNPIENSILRVCGNNMKYASIFDNNGKLILSQQISNPLETSFKLNYLIKGIYLINVTSANGISQTEKFIIK